MVAKQRNEWGHFRRPDRRPLGSDFGQLKKPWANAGRDSIGKAGSNPAIRVSG